MEIWNCYQCPICYLLKYKYFCVRYNTMLCYFSLLSNEGLHCLGTCIDRVYIFVSNANSMTFSRSFSHGVAYVFCWSVTNIERVKNILRCWCGHVTTISNIVLTVVTLMIELLLLISSSIAILRCTQIHTIVVDYSLFFVF